jgi:hypothetical protein
MYIHTQARQIAQILLETEFQGSQLITLIDEVLSWSGNQLDLTRLICELTLQYKADLVAGEEKNFINYIIQEHIIKNWQQQGAAEHLIKAQNIILPRLQTYKNILQGRITNEEMPDYAILIEEQLLLNNNGFLEVAKRLYREVFNLDWVNQEISNAAEIKRKQTTRFTALLSFASLWVFILGTTLLMLNRNSTPVKPRSNTITIPEICKKRYTTIPLANDIKELEILQAQQTNKFPEQCAVQLQELYLIQGAIDLASNGFVAAYAEGDDALDFLCQIPTTSNNLKEAKYWVQRWYRDPAWQRDIDKAFQDNPICKRLVK